MAGRRLSVALAVVVLAVGVLVGRAAAGSSTFTAPAYAGDFPDPALLTAGGTYWAYATGSAGRNLQVMSSPDLHAWTAPVDPLPALPSWASAGSTWAPSVIQVGASFVMWYTVHDPAVGRQCLSVATSSTPAGPFSDTSAGPAVCQAATDGGSIDPDIVRTSTGQLDLVWKSDDNAIGQPTHLWGAPLAATGTALAGSPSLLLSEDAAWQSPSMEGPSVVAAGGLWYLFYGASSYASASSGVGYATSPTLLGTYTDRSRSGPWLGTTANAIGPQGPAVFTDSAGTQRLAFAAWYGTVGYPAGERALWVGSLSFSRRGVPTLR